MSKPWGFLIAYGALAAAVLLGIVGFNVVVDPFRRFELVSIEGFNAQRPMVSSNARMSKAGSICHLAPSQIIFGTSRVEVGIDPRHPVFSDIPGPVYNAALAGTGIHELRLTLQHAIYASSRLKRALVGIDFLMFNAHREGAAYGTEVFDFDAARLLASPRDTCLRNFFYDAADLIGIKGLGWSSASLRAQMAEPPVGDHTSTMSWISLYEDDGFRRKFSTIERTIVPGSGFRGLFGVAQETYYAKKVWRAGREQRYCFDRDGQPNTLDEFRLMVRLALSSGVDVRFFINPVHARMLIAVHATGVWPQYEDWKRALVRIIAEESSLAGKTPTPLWDFSGFNSVTTEVVPSAGDTKTSMKWFWEPSHYRKEAGDLMLNRMFGRPGPSDFGVVLTPQNIEDSITQTREGINAYSKAQPEDAQIARGAVEGVMATAEGANCGYDVIETRKGARLVAAGNKPAAEAAFREAQRLHADDLARYAAIRAPYRETGFEHALEEARQGRGGEPRLNTWIEYQTRGIARSDKGDPVGAAADFKSAIELGPPNTALHFLRGNALLAANVPADAAREFSRGLELDPKNETLRLLLDKAVTMTSAR